MVQEQPGAPARSDHVLARGTRPVAQSASGLMITDTEGTEYLDGSSGAVVSCLGHGNSRVISAIAEQLSTLDYAHRGQFDHGPTADLGRRLAAIAGIPDGCCYFFCSGSEAVEAALKVAALFQYLTGGPEGRVASRAVSYHGATAETTRLTGHRGKRGAYDPIYERFSSLPALRAPEPQSTPHSSTFLTEMAPVNWAEQPGALLLETMPGASAGAISPGAGYYEDVRRYCDDTGSLWIADEVMTGMGRTGTWFAYQHWDATPDIVCVGKGLGAGYWPISAIVVRPEIADVILRAAPLPVGHTYSNHPAGVAAAHAVIDDIVERDLLSATMRAGETLRAALEEVATGLHGGRVTGAGLFNAVHFDGAPQGPSASDVVAACRDERLLVYAAPRADPTVAEAVLITPPLDISDHQIAELARRFKRALTRI